MTFSTMPPSRSPLRRKSAKRATEDRVYGKIKLAVITRDGRCMAGGVWPEVPCGGYKWDVHHIASRARAPELRMEPSNLTTLCRPHHDAIHADPALATQRGFMASAPGSTEAKG